LTYHPPIFSGLKSLTLQNSLSKSLLECISEGVYVYTIHTAADVAVNGTNDWMASGLLKFAESRQGVKIGEDELIRPGQGKGVRALKENNSPPTGHEGCGMGRIVDLSEVGKSFTKEEAVKAVKQTLGLQHCEFPSRRFVLVWSRGLTLRHYSRQSLRNFPLSTRCSPSSLVTNRCRDYQDYRHVRRFRIFGTQGRRSRFVFDR
jgi:putative NIF3 family GTP cyclohydrolase 1 type 2